MFSIYDNNVLYNNLPQFLTAMEQRERVQPGAFAGLDLEVFMEPRNETVLKDAVRGLGAAMRAQDAAGDLNILMNADAYKSGHDQLYPPGTEYVYLYLESRAGGEYPEAMVFGLQYILKRFFTVRVTQEMVEVADTYYENHGIPFNREGWEYIVNKHEGRLPVAIKAVPEGTRVPESNVLATIVNTDPKCFWLPGALETAFMRVWYPVTVASRSLACKRVIKKYLDLTSDNPDAELMYRLHDFGSRGVSSAESAGIGGMAHLINFTGSDTLSALPYATRWYGAKPGIGGSVPASEHSTTTTWGREREADAYRNQLRKFGKKGGVFSSVTDSYDHFNAVENIWGTELRQHVIDSGVTFVARPDSGDVRTVPMETVKSLGASFGEVMNGKGYLKVQHSAVLQGDGIKNEKVIEDIYSNLVAAGYSADNLLIGMGGGLLQMINRDTMRFALKCSAICIDGVWHDDIQKDPKTDPGKRSKKGQFALVYEGGKLVTVPLYHPEGGSNAWQDELVLVFKNGDMQREYTYDQVRERAWKI